MHIHVRVALLALLFAGASTALAQDTVNDRLRKLEAALQSMQQELSEKDRQIESLNNQVRQLKRQVPSAEQRQDEDQALLDSMVGERESSTTPDLDLTIGNLRLTDISAIINVAAGASDQHDEVISTLQGGAHDPKERGFNFQQLELSIGGAVDPFFTGQAHVVVLEDEVELEEAYATTSSMPWGLEFKVGYYLTEFGRVNQEHPHSWAWIDQPVVNSRFFGGDGMRGAGARLGWLTPAPWYSEFLLGMQDADGDLMVSFLGEGHDHGDEHGHEEEEDEEHHFEEGIGGRPIHDRETRSLEEFVYSFRWVNGLDLTDTVSTQFGVSTVYGPNYTGDDAYTWIYGADLVLKLHPLDRPRPLLTWQTEVMQRDYHADSYVTEDDDVFPEDVLRDWGLYTQVLHNLNREWSWGVRYEYVTAEGASFEEAERIDFDHDPNRDSRHRVSPLIVWHPTEFSRLRLQYNYDVAEHLEENNAHSLWLGFEFLLGSHPAHSY